DGGPDRYSLTILRKSGEYWRARRVAVGPKDDDDAGEDEKDEWHSVFMGLAFESDRTLYASEGNTGRVRAINAATAAAQHSFRLNTGGYKDSYTGDLAFDRERGILYVLDQANFRMVSIDTRKRQVLASVRLGRLPFAIALSGDARHAYVTNVGMFEYQALPGADPKRARETGLTFPAFGFPSPEAASGARRETAAGAVDVPGLGDPNVPESNSVAMVDLEDPAAPRVERFVRTGLPFGAGVHGGSSPSGVAASPDFVFVSNAHNDSVSFIDPASGTVRATVEIRVPGLEDVRGVMPLGLAWYAPRNWLLVAEAGINAIGIIDVGARRVLGHLPAAWFPTRIALDGENVYVSNAKGQGTGPNSDPQMRETFQGAFRNGSISVFRMPAAEEVAQHTARVMANNGFVPSQQAAPALPEGIRHVVLIVKENRTFDEVFGDIPKAANGAVAGRPELAILGRNATVAPRHRTLRPRQELKNVNVTPNHHALATRWSFSDNFYADSEVSVDGHHWLAGSYPDAWVTSSLEAAYGGKKDFRLPTTAPGRLLFAESSSSVHPEEQLEAGALWHHLERHGVTFRNFGEGFELAGVQESEGLKPTGARFLTNMPMPGPLYSNTSRQYPVFNMNIPDQYRASQLISELESRYGHGEEPLPRFIFIHLPNDHMAKPRPEDGYPYELSFVADNDYALGRIVEYLSSKPWWREMAVFVTEDDAQGGVDHVDSHRTVLMALGPYVKRNYVSHTHSSFPGLLKTVFRILRLPPLNLYDATASDLADCFTEKPDFAGYKVLPLDPRLFDPAKARDPLDPRPSPKMDDPAVLREQHRRR
ncbi:MAG TPA: bifunctional YncE family protein/alkaline phosphatase family protein, partial [Bryobacteraceae bacterium]